MNRLLNIPYSFRLTTLIIMCVLRCAGTVYADTSSIQVADSIESGASHSIFDGLDEERLRAYDDSLRSLYYPEAILHTSESVNSESPDKFKAPSKTDLEETYVPSFVDIDDSSVVGDIPIESGISPAGSRTCNVPLKTTFSYDLHDRPVMEKRPASQLPITWEYKGNTVTESINGISIKRTRNPRGELISSEDDGGKITYTLAPDFTQSLNRYSYCLNNPLSYIDEDGEFLWIVVIGAAVVTGVTNVIVHWDDIKSAGGGWNSFWKGAAYFGVGAVAGGAGAVAGMAVLPVISANIASIATMTSAQFTAATMGILPGAAFGAASGASEGFLMNFGNTFIDGGNLSDALSLGATGFIESGLSGAILGGISGGYSAYNAGEDIWSGNLSKVPLSESLLRNDANSFFQGAADNGPTYTGYFGYENGTVKYVGITGRDPNIRFQEHTNSHTLRSGLDFHPIESFNSKMAARIWEQNMINKYGLQKNGGQLFNKRNEISSRLWDKYGIKF